MVNNEQLAPYDNVPYDVQNILRFDSFLTSLHINSVVPVSGGVAHRVYGIESEDGKYYLKIRGNHFAAIPSIACNSADIANEYRALVLFSQAAPKHFPRVFSFNNEFHYLLISDVVREGEKFDTLLLNNKVSDETYGAYGQTLASLKQATITLKESVRSDEDREYYKTVLHHRLGYRNHPILNAAIAELSSLSNRQLILGDAAPKNIGVQKDATMFTFFDLETAHRGNPEFDYAYGLAHALLHALPHREYMQKVATLYIQGYGETSYNPLLIYRLLAGIILYRLNSVIPYPIALSSEQRIMMESHIERVLFNVTGNESIYSIIDQITYL
jgi:aminoglycoside phosphotransferase (APT) family kinase protein